MNRPPIPPHMPPGPPWQQPQRTQQQFVPQRISQPLVQNPGMPDPGDLLPSGNFFVGSILTIGIKRTKGAPDQFFVGCTGRSVKKNASFYPISQEGWNAAWAQFSQFDPAAACGYLNQVAHMRRVRAITSMPKLTWMTGCVLESGYNLSPFRVNMRGNFYFVQDRLIIVDKATMEMVGQFPYASMIALRVGGPGAVTTGGGFMGGGFGLKGAAEGMLFAYALNSLTTRTTIRTVIEVQDSARDLVWSHNGATPQRFEQLLIPVRARLRECAYNHTMDNENPSERLNKLNALHDAHQIDDAEFERTRRQILNSI